MDKFVSGLPERMPQETPEPTTFDNALSNFMASPAKRAHRRRFSRYYVPGNRRVLRATRRMLGESEDE